MEAPEATLASPPGRQGSRPPAKAMVKRARKSGADRGPAPAPAPALSGSAQLEARVAELVAKAAPQAKELAKTEDELALARTRLRRERGIEAAGSSWRDWGGLPGNVLKTLAGVIARTCDDDYQARIGPYKANLVRYSRTDDGTVEWRPPPPPEGSANGLLFFSLVCRAWREGQVDLGTLRTRVSDILVHDDLEIFNMVLKGKNPIPKRWNPPYYAYFPVAEKDLAQLAASCGALEILKFMHFKDGPGWKSLRSNYDNNFCAFRAAKTKIIEWSIAMEKAGHKDAIAVYFNVESEWSGGEYAVHAAALSGNLEFVQELDEKGHRISVSACANAAQCGHLDILQYLFQRGIENDPVFLEREEKKAKEVCNFAAGAGELEALQLARANDCPWDWRCAAWAVNNGHVKVLRWARENGCEWTAEIQDQAAEKLGYTDNFGNLVV